MPSSKAINHQYGVSPLHARTVPIGEYGFLSDGEVSALLAPGGSVDWMCMPRFDSPSVFGSLLGRHAGTFRISPTDVDVPVDTRYIPGTMIIETSWGTPTGWIVVRDALLIGSVAPRRQHPLPQPSAHPERLRRGAHLPADDSLRLRRGAGGHGLRTGARLRPQARALDLHRSGLSPGRRRSPRAPTSSSRLTSDLRLGFEGGQASARTLLKQGDTRYVALSWGGAPPPLTFEDAYKKQVWTAHHWQHWLARGKFPDHPWRGLSPAQRADPEGAHVRADRGDRGGRHRPRCRRRREASGTTTTATPGSATPPSRLWGLYSLGLRLGGTGLLLLHRRRRRARRQHPDHVRHRRRGRTGGVRA